jgi:hypothetical protein
MIKKFYFLVLFASILSSALFAQNNESGMPDVKSKVFRYKLKLSYAKNAEELDVLKSNPGNEDLFECSESNFGFKSDGLQDLANKIIKTYESKGKDELNTEFNNTKSENLLLKALGVDSAFIEIFENEQYNYTAMYLGRDTLIGLKKTTEPSITYYLLRPGMHMKCLVDEGMLDNLHNTQATFEAGQSVSVINNKNCRIIKTKMLNKVYATTALCVDGVETPNLIYKFQYPTFDRTFPYQFNLYKNDNKYCFTLKEFKQLANSKGLEKRLKKLNEIKANNVTLNEIFDVAGFDY